MQRIDIATGNDFAREAAPALIVQGKNEELAGGGHPEKQGKGSAPITKADDIKLSKYQEEVRECFPAHT